MTLVHVYFADLKMFRYITDELFSWQDILAAFGGLVGLCTGFSFLSAAEIVYFFTLRCALYYLNRTINYSTIQYTLKDSLVFEILEQSKC